MDIEGNAAVDDLAVSSAIVSSAMKLCEDDTTFSDSSGLSNKDKWGCITAVFQCPDCNLFYDFSFDEVYETDHPTLAEAAWYVADLRAQFYQQTLEESPMDTYAHSEFILNRQWSTRFRERVALHQIAAASGKSRLM